MHPENSQNTLDKISKIAGYVVRICAAACIAVIFYCLFFNNDANKPAVVAADENLSTQRLVPFDAWRAPDSTTIPSGKQGDVIKYGKELIAHTADYFGP